MAWMYTSGLNVSRFSTSNSNSSAYRAALEFSVSMTAMRPPSPAKPFANVRAVYVFPLPLGPMSAMRALRCALCAFWNVNITLIHLHLDAELLAGRLHHDDSGHNLARLPVHDNQGVRDRQPLLDGRPVWYLGHPYQPVLARPLQQLLVIALELGAASPHLQRPVRQAVGLAVAEQPLLTQLLKVGPQVALEEPDAAFVPLSLGLQVRPQPLNLALDELSAPLNLRLVPGDPAQRPVSGAVIGD